MTVNSEGSDFRILLYGHDTYGLGHIRRNTAVGARLLKDRDDSSALLITGSPLAHRFVLPQRFDYIKIPSVTKDDSGRYRSRYLLLNLEEITSLREALIRQTVLGYRPAVFIVDHSPAGMTDEVRRSLSLLKRRFPATRLILGLRDVIDDAEKVRHAWRSNGIYELLEDIYDHILVYGSREVCDVISEYHIAGKARDKLSYVGYISREDPIRPPEDVRKELQMATDRLVTLTIGGGEDGFHVVSHYLRALSIFKDEVPFDTLLFTGPFMSEENRLRIAKLCQPGWPVRTIDFTNDFLSYLNASDLVVSMGGYNSVCEILSLRKPSIIVPRVFPRTEQFLRAERLSQMGMVRMIHPRSLTPEILRREILLTLDRFVVPARTLEMDGLANVSKLVGELVAAGDAQAPPKVGQKC